MNTLNTVESTDVSLLVVDDHDLVRSALKRMFHRQFARIITAATTHEGLDIIKDNLEPHSTVISDHHNPLSTYNGATLAELSKPFREVKGIPFYLISGGVHGTELDTIKTLERDQIIHGFIPKPFSISEIRDKVLGRYKSRR